MSLIRCVVFAPGLSILVCSVVISAMATLAVGSSGDASGSPHPGVSVPAVQGIQPAHPSWGSVVWAQTPSPAATLGKEWFGFRSPIKKDLRPHRGISRQLFLPFSHRVGLEGALCMGRGSPHSLGSQTAESGCWYLMCSLFLT